MVTSLQQATSSQTWQRGQFQRDNRQTKLYRDTRNKDTRNKDTRHQNTCHQNTYGQTQSKHIMVISDALELVEDLQTELTCKGYQVSVIHDGLRGLLAIKRFSPDLVIVDWNPPRLSGLEICQRFRTGNGERPIILLTRGDRVQDRISGFEKGADDCISLPFVKEEFVARLNAKLTKQHVPEPSQASLLRCADIVLNRNTREVFRADQLVKLTAKEFDFLEYLMTHYFQVLTRAQILENVWGYDYTGSSNIIEVYVRYLRNKLNDTGKQRLLRTVRGVGYILREIE